MMFGTVMSYARTNGDRYYCLELNPADPMNKIEALDGFFKQVKKNFLTSESPVPILHFHPTSGSQMEAVKAKTLALPLLTSQKIFGDIRFKCMVAGEISKKRVCVFDAKAKADLDSWLMERTAEEVVVIPSVPTDIPVVAAVICEEMIPPLCHVALLCQNRRTPCCFDPRCISTLGVICIDGRVADGIITKTGYCLNGDVGDNIELSTPPRKIEVPKPNTNVAQLISIHEDKQNATDSHIIGAKAAQMATIEGIYNQPIFKGAFVIPFHHYEKLVYGNKAVTERIQNVLSKMSSKSFDFQEFVNVQEIIRKQMIDQELVKSVMDRIQQHKMTSVIFRSSTNAEDLTGFNGAGLYESVSLGGKNLTDPLEVAIALNRVFASVWNPK